MSVYTQIFFIFNRVYGGFSYVINHQTCGGKLKKCPSGYLFVCLMVLSLLYSSTSPFICLGFDIFPGMEVSKYNCFFCHLCLVIVFLHRLYKMEKTKHLFDTVLSYTEPPKDCLVKCTVSITFILLLNLFLLVTFFQGRDLPTRFVVDMAISFYTSKFMYFCIISQPVYLLSSVEYSITRLNSSLYKKYFEATTVQKMRHDYTIYMFLCTSCNKVYAVDTLMILMILIPDYYLKIDEFMITFFSFVIDKNLVKFVGTTFFSTLQILVNAPGVVWFCELTGKMNRKVKL
jgi:hypothetical protein